MLLCQCFFQLGRQRLFVFTSFCNVIDLDIKSLSNDFEALCKQQPRYQSQFVIPGFSSIITAAFSSQAGSIADKLVLGRKPVH
jgi:hypothetical protein